MSNSNPLMELIGYVGESIIAVGDKIGDVGTTAGEIFNAATDESRSTLLPGTRPLKGDVIARKSEVWWHFGIYEGDDTVYHYYPDPKGLKKGKIQTASFEEFVNGCSTYFIVVLGDTTTPWILEADYTPEATGLRPRFREEMVYDPESPYVRYAIFPPDDIIARAKCLVGKDGYHLFNQNCEHFAFWCQTDEMISLQSERFKELGKALVGQYEILKPTKKRQAKVSFSQAEIDSAISYYQWRDPGYEYSLDDEIMRLKSKVGEIQTEFDATMNKVFRKIGEFFV